MQDPKSTSQRIALTRLEGIGRLPMALWSILEAKREATSSRVTWVQQAHGHHPPRLGVEIHQRLGVPQISQGIQFHMLPILSWERLLMALWPQGGREYIHQRPGSPAFPRTRGPNASNLSLGTAANGAETPRKTRVHSKRVRPAEPAASQSGKSAKHSNLTGRGLGQGISFKTKCPGVRNSVKPIPG